MYGYVIVNKQELKFREFDTYRSYYCGLCDALGENHGLIAKTTLSFDFTFLTMLLSGLYEPDTVVEEKRCMVHPIKKHMCRRSEITDYVADMTILMAYYKCLDDWNDDKDIRGVLTAKHFKCDAEKIVRRYPKQSDVIQAELGKLSKYEKAGETDIDKVSATFGELMAAIFSYRDDEWQMMLRQTGFYLGKFIYILDAYDDLESDIKKNRYNVLRDCCKMDGFEVYVQGILNGVMARCARSFEYLPIVQDAEILKNIIYSGVWTGYEKARRRRAEKAAKSGN